MGFVEEVLEQAREDDGGGLGEFLEGEGGGAEAFEAEKKFVVEVIFVVFTPFDEEDAFDCGPECFHAAKVEEGFDPADSFVAEDEAEFVEMLDRYVFHVGFEVRVGLFGILGFAAFTLSENTLAKVFTPGCFLEP